MLVTDRGVEREVSAATVETTVDGLLGSHPRIQNRSMRLAIDELLGASRALRRASMPCASARSASSRREIVEREKRRLRMNEFTPRVLTSFVRNQLIDEVYLPLVGANLAKQIGAVGREEAHRPDGPAAARLAARLRQDDAHGVRREQARARLHEGERPGARPRGHLARSRRGAERAPRARRSRRSTSRFEMGNNVMLYLDDIQHTSSELLQKFISLCDGQRKIEGVWKGQIAHVRPPRQEVLRRDGGQPVHRDGRRASRSPTCSRTAPTPTTSATSSAAHEDLFALELPRERAHLEQRARAARDARARRRPEARAAWRAARTSRSPRSQHGYSRGGGRGDHVRPQAHDGVPGGAARGEQAVHRVGLAGGRLPHRAAVQAAGQLPQHEQARREDRLGDERRGARSSSSTITTRANRRRSPPAPSRTSSSSPSCAVA